MILGGVCKIKLTSNYSEEKYTIYYGDLNSQDINTLYSNITINYRSTIYIELPINKKYKFVGEGYYSHFCNCFIDTNLEDCNKDCMELRFTITENNIEDKYITIDNYNEPC